VVHLRNLSTGEDREIYHALGHTTCTWAVQHSKLFCADSSAEKTDILSIAVDSGRVERLHTSAASSLATLYASRDDRALYLSGGKEEEEILRLDVATGQETTVERFPSGYWGLVSPDERWLIRKGDKGAEIRPMSGGDWKTLASNVLGQGNATPDGNWLFYRGDDAAGKKGLYRVATAGGPPERMGDFPTKSDSGGTLEIRMGATSWSPACSAPATNSGRWRTSCLPHRNRNPLISPMGRATIHGGPP
jgi:hypothetical protein